MQRQQLHGLDRRQGVRRDPVDERIELHLGEEAAPLRAGQVGVGVVGIGAVVQLWAPALPGHLGHRVVAEHHPPPEVVDVARAGQHGGHAHDRHVDPAPAPRPGERQQRVGPLADVAVQLREGGRVITHRGDLADHDHAVGLLSLRVDLDQLVPLAADPLGGDPQAPDVQPLERLPDRLGGGALRLQRAPGLLEGLHERGVGAARRVAGGRVQQHGLAAVQGGLLKAGLDRAGRHRLLGEQVGRAHQEADLRAAHGEGGRERRDHRRRSRVVDAAGEHHRQLLGRLVLQQAIDELLPQHEAGARADVPAALPPLEHEAARAVPQEQIEQPRRRHVQVGLDALGLELACLSGASPREQGHRRLRGADDRQLLLAQLRRREPQQPDPPGPARQLLGRALDHALQGLAPDEGQGEERQRAGVGDRPGEAGRVAHPRHRTLSDGVPQPVGPGEGRSRRVGAGRHRLALVPRHLPLQAPDQIERPGEGLGQGGGQGRVLAGRQQPLLQRAHPQRLRQPLGQRVDRQIGPLEDPVAPDHPRLGSIHARHGPADPLGQARLGEQRQLAVEHHPRGPAHEGGPRGVQADPALEPHGQRHLGDQPLQEHERGDLADAAAALEALGDEPGGAGGLGGLGLRDRDHLDQHAWVRQPRRHDALGDHERDRVGQRRGHDPLGDPDPEPDPAPGQGGQRRAGGVWIATQIEHPQRTRPPQRLDQLSVGEPKGGDPEDMIRSCVQREPLKTGASYHRGMLIRSVISTWTPVRGMRTPASGSVGVRGCRQGALRPSGARTATRRRTRTRAARAADRADPGRR